ncbi:restriction endonuclease subunit S [Brachybacterium sp. J153]|uniref:restriction endonuclease subunit S n=1 Tax=Brachybacterium sp. J153 TaxID=3116488 RepID=UPI002E7A1275|nr:restriction endonuclease subunit S [Brachybacterium sp. J153]MEE1618731.1 restriction endonuclease subunit S [Brachybacterium sp. J153]
MSSTLGDFLLDSRPGFACGETDDTGIFQFRMHNVTKASDISLETRRRIPRDSHRNLNQFMVTPGDVLFNATNSPENTGKSILIPDLDEPAVYSNHFVRLRTNPQELQPEYLWRFLQWHYQSGTFQGMIRAWVNQASVSRADLLALPLDPPPLHSQRRIASILDEAAAIRTKRRAQLAHLDELPQALFRETFAGRADRIALMSEVALSIDNGVSPVAETRSAAPGEWGVLKLSAVSYGEFRWRENKAFLGDSAILERHEVKRGDVLMTRKNTPELVGSVALVRDTPAQIAIPDLIFRIKFNDDLLDGTYAQALLMSPTVRRRVRNLAGGSAASMSNISKARLSTLQIPIPPLNAQKSYAEQVEVIHAERDRVARALKADEELFAALQYRAFRGEL